MLNSFPDLLAFGLVSPLIIRVATGLIFINFGYTKLFTERIAKAALFDAVGLTPGDRWVWVIGFLELTGGILLAIGLFTQVTSLVLMPIALGALILKSKRPEAIASQRELLALLFLMTLSLLFSGAGFFALDLPL